MERSKPEKKCKLRRRSETVCRDQSSKEIALCAFQKCSRGPREGLTRGVKLAETLTLRNSSKSEGCASSGGGETVVVGSPIPNTRCPLDQIPVTRGSVEEKYRSDLLDLSTEDQQSSDLV
jgi:hypothetical protein